MQIYADYILFIAGALPVGFLLGYLLGRIRYRPEIDLLKGLTRKAESDLKTLQEEYIRISGEHAAAREKILLLEEMRESMADTFRGISVDTLQASNRAFLDLAKATLSEYVTAARSDLETRSKTVSSMIQPVREALDRYDQQVTSMERQREKAYGGLYRQIESLAASQTTLQKETGKLASALRVPHVRGRWGEITLRRTAELSGMQNRCDFYEQVSVPGDKSSQRPDMVIHLPGNRMLVVDAKVPLSAYLDSLEAEGEAAQEERLDAHARQVRAHIVGLSKKAYWESLETTPEFVVMFIPGENFFSAALSRSPELLEEGAQKNVLLATPTTLLALLKTVAYVWNQETAAENAKTIRDLGRELYDRLGLMTAHLERLGRDMEKCIQAYNQTVGSFTSRVLVSANKFSDLGIPVKNGKEELAVRKIEAVPRKVQAG